MLSSSVKKMVLLVGVVGIAVAFGFVHAFNITW